jgi:hypothetical protein
MWPVSDRSLLTACSGPRRAASRPFWHSEPCKIVGACGFTIGRYYQRCLRCSCSRMITLRPGATCYRLWPPRGMCLCMARPALRIGQFGSLPGASGLPARHQIMSFKIKKARCRYPTWSGLPAQFDLNCATRPTGSPPRFGRAPNVPRGHLPCDRAPTRTQTTSRRDCGSCAPAGRSQSVWYRTRACREDLCRSPPIAC